MILRKGNMWTDSKADLRLFTGNATVRSDGALVMGRGAALEAQKLHPGCNKLFGSIIRNRPVYGIIIIPTKPPLGVFQVKHSYWDKASLALIEMSCEFLVEHTALEGFYPIICVNFPGIGYGGLDRSTVLPILQTLPDNVEVWEK